MNMPTLIIAIIVAVVFVAIIRHEIKKRKNGGSGCSCGCEGCNSCKK